MLSSLRSKKVLVDYNRRQIALPELDDKAICVVRCEPVWEAVDVSDWEEQKRCVRLAESDSSRSNMRGMHKWLLNNGARPIVFCEAVAVARELGVGDLKMACLGSLWQVDDVYCFACWQDGSFHLHPIDYSFGSDFLCPIVTTSMINPLPSMDVLVETSK